MRMDHYDRLKAEKIQHCERKEGFLHVEAEFNLLHFFSNKTNRTGIRVEGNSIISIKPHNINSEGIIKGSVQVPGDGNPIILMTEHPSIGGYPKIATVILADFAKLVQYPSSTNFFFKEVTLVEAESIYVERNKRIKSQLKKIIHN